MAGFLTLSELLTLELSGKKVAMGRYDEILWKIRSGYLVVLAGTLGFFVTKGSDLILTAELLAIIIWFSFVAWIVDIAFRRRQLRVVKAYNDLVAAAIKNMPEDEGLGNIETNLFYFSGERLEVTGLDKDISISMCLFPSSLIYVGTTFIAGLLLLIQA